MKKYKIWGLLALGGSILYKVWNILSKQTKRIIKNAKMVEETNEIVNSATDDELSKLL